MNYRELYKNVDVMLMHGRRHISEAQPYFGVLFFRILESQKLVTSSDYSMPSKIYRNGKMRNRDTSQGHRPATDTYRCDFPRPGFIRRNFGQEHRTIVDTTAGQYDINQSSVVKCRQPFVSSECRGTTKDSLLVDLGY